MNIPIVVKVDEWLRDAGEFMSELPNRSVASQLARYDEVKTGLGFVLVLTATTRDDMDGKDPTDVDELTNHAVFKIKGEWYVVVEDNISDIAKALVNLMTASLVDRK